jgi:hypothetical protein
MRNFRPASSRLLPFLIAPLVAAASSFAADSEPTPEPAPTPDSVRERVLRMTDFFDTTLPGVLGKHNLALDFKPKFGDLRDYEYVRLPFEVRYGKTARLELRAGLTPYVPNPVNSGEEHNWGLGELRLGARYDLRPLLTFFEATTAGVEVRVPLGNPPVDLNDHYTHVKPFVAASRRLKRWPATLLYANAAYDRSIRLTQDAPPPPEVIRQDIFEVAPGLLYKPSEFGYFGEYRLRHIRTEVDWHLAHRLRAGAIWDVPLARSKKWKLPGKFQLEISYRVDFEEGLETDQGVSTRVSWRTSLREVFTPRP